MTRLRPQAGFSMVEVLVSILIVSLGILALAGLMVRSASLSKAAEFRGTASLLAADMADRIRANPAAAAAGDYDYTPTALASGFPESPANPCNVVATPCTAAQLAAKDLADWQAALYASLPGGTGWVSYSAASNQTADIYVMWRDPSTEDRARNLIDLNTCPAGMDAGQNATCLYFRAGR